MSDDNFEVTETYLNKMFDRVRKLTAKAERTDNEAEAQLFRAKAQELIDRYRISEARLISTGASANVPIVKKIDVWRERGKSPEFDQHLDRIFAFVASHVDDVEFLLRTEFDPARKDYARRGYLVGYPVDIRYAELLFESAALMFIAKLDPAVDRSLTDSENVYRLRSAGRTRREIAKLLWDIDTHSAHARVGKLYEAACADRDESPAVSGRDLSVKTYRQVYADAFVQRFYARLWLDRQRQRDSGADLPAMKDRTEKVRERFYEEFPHLRPVIWTEAEEKARREKLEARWAAERAERESCRNCRPSEGYECRKHRPREETRAERIEARRFSQSPAAQAGSRAGRSAADSVRVSRFDDRAAGDRETGTSGRKSLA